MPKGSNLSPEHQRRAGQQRAAQRSFLQHNQRIAPDGPSAVSAYMRAPAGSQLLDPSDVQFLVLADMRKSRDPGCAITEQEQRLLYGWYVWRAVWDGLNSPAKPDADQFLQRALKASTRTRAGLPLEHPLDIVFVAADDFFGAAGKPLKKDQQRARFRAALARGRQAAQAWSAQIARERAQASRTQPRQVGRRVAMNQPATTSAFVSSQRQPDHYHYGRPDLPAFHPKNIRPARPYDIPTGERLQQRYWISSDLDSSGNE